MRDSKISHVYVYCITVSDSKSVDRTDFCEVQPQRRMGGIREGYLYNTFVI